MLDVRFAVAHGLWIMGATVALAALSYHQWAATERAKSMSSVFVEPTWQLSNAAAALMVAAGFVLMARTTWWERTLWLVVWSAAAVSVWRLRRHLPRR